MLAPSGCAILIATALLPADAQLADSYFPAGLIGLGSDQGVTVASRARPEFDAPGIRTGSFVIRPGLSEAAGFDSNSSGGRPDQPSSLLQTSGSLLVTSDWLRNNVSAYLTVDDSRYPQAPKQSHTDFSGAVGQAIDVGPGQITLAASYQLLNQTSRDLNTLPLDHPAQYRVATGRIGWDSGTGYMVLQPYFQIFSFSYDNVVSNGVPTNQTYRNRTVYEGAMVARFGEEALRSLVLVVRGDAIRHTDPIPGQPSRDADALTVLGGVDYSANAIWRYRALIGYELRSFASSAFKTVTAPIVEADIIWSPTGLTTVTALANRSIDDGAAETTASYTSTEARISVDHELLPNLLLHGYGDLQLGHYDQGGGNETNITFGASATWLMNRTMRLTASFDQTFKRSDVSNNLDESVALLRLSFGL